MERKTLLKNIVFFQGAFDMFHYGQLVAIKRAKKFGYLIVGVNSDEAIKFYKKKEVVIPCKFRMKTIAELKCVDKVIKINKKDVLSPLAILKKYKVKTYVICEEWDKTKDKEIKYMKKTGGKMVVLPYFKGISSTDIKNKLVKNLIKHNKTLCADCHRKM